jgi:hypothetical protein
MKLKTLEDIETYHGEYDKIRDEAIKWVKELQKHEKTLIDVGCFVQLFNLTEEDLEEKEK